MIRLCLGNLSIIYQSTTKCRSKRCAQFDIIARLSVIVNCCWLGMMKYWVNLSVFYLLKLTKKCFTMNHKKDESTKKNVLYTICLQKNVWTEKQRSFNRGWSSLYVNVIRFSWLSSTQSALVIRSVWNWFCLERRNGTIFHLHLTFTFLISRLLKHANICWIAPGAICSFPIIQASHSLKIRLSGKKMLAACCAYSQQARQLSLHCVVCLSPKCMPLLVGNTHIQEIEAYMNLCFVWCVVMVVHRKSVVEEPFSCIQTFP